MKKNGLIILCLICTVTITAQVQKLSKLYSNTVEYGLIENESLLLPTINQSDAIEKITHYKVENSSSKNTEYTTSTYNWDYRTDTLLTLNYDGKYIYRKIFSGDYLKKMAEIVPDKDKEDWQLQTTRVSVMPFYTYLSSFSWAQSRDKYPFIHPNNLEEDLFSFMDFDVKIKDTLNITLYMKDHRSFSVYNGTLDDYYYNFIKGESTITDSLYRFWEGRAFYISSDRENDSYPPFRRSDSQEGLKDIIKETFQKKGYPPYRYLRRYLEGVKRGVVEDKLFFQGNFKIIEQKGNTYIFNLHNGRIYILTPYRIDYIGRLNLKNYPQIKNRNYLVEDRDNNEIIVFAPIDWDWNSAYPMPKIRIMSIEDFKSKLKYNI